VILGFTIAQSAVAGIAGLLCVILALARRKPNDVTFIALGLVEVLLIAQVVVALIAPAVGNHASGNLVEFWGYLITAIIIPPLAAFWALAEPTRWGTLVLGIAALAIAVMVYRMYQIWTVQLA
jgi:hypothetical protein